MRDTMREKKSELVKSGKPFNDKSKWNKSPHKWVKGVFVPPKHEKEAYA